jgi:hypothetical protein
MTTIRVIEQEPPASPWGLEGAMRTLYLSVASGLLVICAAVGIMACMFISSDLEEFLTVEMQQRVHKTGRPTLVCSQDKGEVLEDGQENCFDFRGFRVVFEDGARIFSLRYSNPLFIFGVQRGMMFVNEHIPQSQLESEKASFLGYLND